MPFVRHAVGDVEDLRDPRGAAGLLQCLIERAGHSAAEARLDLLHHVRTGLLHPGDAADDLDLLIRGESADDLRGQSGGQVGEDQRDRLRVLVRDEGQQIVRPRFLQERERHAVEILPEVLHHFPGRLLAEAAGEQFFRPPQAAAFHLHAGGVAGFEVRQHRGLLLRGDLLDSHDLCADRFDGSLRQQREHLLGLRPLQGEQQDRGFAGVVERAGHDSRGETGS